MATAAAASAASETLPKFRYLSAWFCPYAHRATLALEHHHGRVDYEWVEALVRRIHEGKHYGFVEELHFHITRLSDTFRFLLSFYPVTIILHISQCISHGRL